MSNILESLRLESDGKALFSSEGSGLRPLFECVTSWKGKASGCSLYDKVVGLAAARLIVFSGMISQVETPLASDSAITYLKKHGIMVKAAKTVKMIMNRDMSGQCPMEVLAASLDDTGFYNEILQRMNSSKSRPLRDANSCDTA